MLLHGIKKKLQPSATCCRLPGFIARCGDRGWNTRGAPILWRFFTRVGAPVESGPCL